MNSNTDVNVRNQNMKSSVSEKKLQGRGGGETGGGLSLRSEGGEKQIAFTFTKLVNSLVLIERNTGNVK